MKLASLEAVLGALKQHDVRYLIAGGLAVVAHGYGRLTIDVDLVVQLDGDNVRRALDALASLRYRPVAPVAMEQFAESAVREAWVREKNMVVFGLHSPLHPDTPIDISLRNRSISSRNLRAPWLGKSLQVWRRNSSAWRRSFE